MLILYHQLIFRNPRFFHLIFGIFKYRMNKFIKLPLSKPTPIASFNSLEQITFPHMEALIAKILKIRNEHKQIDLIADFDHTLTQHRLGDRKCDSLFGMWVTSQSIASHFRQQLLDNFKRYGPYQTDPTLQFSEKLKYVDRLYEIQRGLFEKHSITSDHAVQVLSTSQLTYRAHILDLLHELQRIGLKLHIVSGGISDLIYSSLVSVAGKQLIQKVVTIHSNAWQVYREQQSKSFVRFTPTMVHSYNKHLVMREYPAKQRHCILMGDLKSDIYMAYGAGYDQIISIFYGKEGEFDQRALAQAKFDVIIEGDGSHKLVVELLKIISNRHDVDWKYLYRVEPILTTLIL